MEPWEGQATHWEAPPEGRRAFLLCSVLSRAWYRTHPQINSDHASPFNTPSDSHDGQSWVLAPLEDKSRRALELGLGSQQGATQ